MPHPTKPKKKRKGRKANVPEVCNLVLSEQMKKGNRKGAMSAYWRCRKDHEKRENERK